MSGYCDCACRDCFEIAIASLEDDDTNDGLALCWECNEAGCDPKSESECNREDAYDNLEVACPPSEEGEGE